MLAEERMSALCHDHEQGHGRGHLGCLQDHYGMKLLSRHQKWNIELCLRFEQHSIDPSIAGMWQMLHSSVVA
jgi:hypothetical protein